MFPIKWPAGLRVLNRVHSEMLYFRHLVATQGYCNGCFLFCLQPECQLWPLTLDKKISYIVREKCTEQRIHQCVFHQKIAKNNQFCTDPVAISRLPGCSCVFLSTGLAKAKYHSYKNWSKKHLQMVMEMLLLFWKTKNTILEILVVIAKSSFLLGNVIKTDACNAL